VRAALLLPLAMATLAIVQSAFPADAGQAVRAAWTAPGERIGAAGRTARRPVSPAPDAAAAPRPQARRAARRLRRHLLLAVDRSVALRDRPGGRVTAVVGARTEFGSPRVLAVAARRGGWLGVVTSERPNGSLAWVERNRRGLRPRRTAYSLHADLSTRRLELRLAGRRLRRMNVAVGAAASPTPTGRFAVTDKLAGSRYGPYYGCCILAISGRQPRPPAGWTGGDRLAIHGTNLPSTIGAAVSAGCLRAAAADLELLMRRVPLGTPVFIRP
jgi:lipoprotein-anchoring transpeptidase ErfK/SrfK